MTGDQVQRYLNDTASIEGWFFPIDVLLFGAIDEIQRRNAIAGNLFEIGVHHGKSAVLMARMTRDSESLGVCDVFGEQALNVDRSGEGSLDLFRRNMERFAPAAAPHVRVFAKRSELLTPDDTTASCRLIHIDGGHRPVDVVNDLRVAERALLPDGVVVVDDAFNPSWPGVGEGVYQFFAREPRVFAPVIIGGNKAYFVRTEARERAARWFSIDALAEIVRHDAYGFEHKEWLGSEVVVASRKTWVELNPLEAARLHGGT